MSYFKRDQLLEAAHVLWTSVYADEYENHNDRSLGGPGAQLCDHSPRLRDDFQLVILWDLIYKVGDAWGPSVERVFKAMDVLPHEQSDRLYELFMGCMGHGVFLGDDRKTDIALRHAAHLLGLPNTRPPLHIESAMTPWADIAYDIVRHRLRKPWVRRGP